MRSTAGPTGRTSRTVRTRCAASAGGTRDGHRGSSAYVTDRLAEGWTPEQIAGRLRLGIETGLRAVCAETIYGWIYRPARRRNGAALLRAATPVAGGATAGRLAT